MALEPQPPLKVEEVISWMKDRWGVSYDLQLIVRNKCLYLQIMWGYLEQQSFPLDENTYRNNLNKVVEIVNRIGQSSIVKEWIQTVPQKPRVGRALTLPLKGNGCLDEFIVGIDL